MKNNYKQFRNKIFVGDVTLNSKEIEYRSKLMYKQLISLMLWSLTLKM